MAKLLIAEAAEAAVFGMLSVLDGVRQIPDGSGEPLRFRVQMDPQGEASTGHENDDAMHDIFAALILEERDRPS